jgi:hypothetical protein
MNSFRRARVWWLALFVCVIAQPVAAITLQVDYTYDTSNFFGAGNPQGATAGAQAKASLEAAASYFSSILTTSFSAVQTPAPFHSSVSNGLVTWTWNESFSNPTTGADVTVTDPTVPANRYVIYAGANNLTGGTAGIGAVGGFGWSDNITGSNSFSQSDINQINATTSSFQTAVETRGQASGFSSWGGVVSFDNSARTWHFDKTTQPTAGQTDFYSVALHELLHSLGFGETSTGGDTTPWQSFVSGNQFFGNNAEAANNFQPVPLSADLAHWAQGTNSVVYGSSTVQESVMTPSITDGTRKVVTALDVAALKDIGWTAILPPGVNGDYNNNGVVDAADYVIWRDHLGQNFTLPNDTTPGTVTQADYNVWRSNFGASAGSGSGLLVEGSAVPEPASVALLVLGWAALVPCRSRRNASRRAC